MPRVIGKVALSLALTLWLIGLAWAGDNPSTTGVVKSWTAGVGFTLQGSKGGGVQKFALAKNTMVMGKPAEGSNVQVWYTQDSKTRAKTATKVQVQK